MWYFSQFWGYLLQLKFLGTSSVSRYAPWYSSRSLLHMKRVVMSLCNVNMTIYPLVLPAMPTVRCQRYTFWKHKTMKFTIMLILQPSMYTTEIIFVFRATLGLRLIWFPISRLPSKRYLENLVHDATDIATHIIINTKSSHTTLFCDIFMVRWVL